MARKKIKKVSVAPIDPIEGAVSDTLNVTDKVKNAPSINLVQQMTGIPQDGVIYYDGEVVPEGYEEVENPNIITVENTLVGAKLKLAKLTLTPVTYNNFTYLVTNIPITKTFILRVFCRNRFGYVLIPIQNFNVSGDYWVIVDQYNALSGSYMLNIIYLEFENDINIGA